MTKRMIVSEIWEDDFFTSIPFIHRLIWLGIITICADDQGRFQDSPTLIRSKIFPLDDMPLQDIEGALEIFARVKKILRYTRDGKKVIQILNWWKHQTPRWIGRSSLPAPEGWTDRTRYHGTGNRIITENFNDPGGYSIAYSIEDSIADSTEGYTINDGDGDGDIDGKGDDDVDDDVDIEKENSSIDLGIKPKNKKRKFDPHLEDIPNLIRSYVPGKDGIPGHVFKDDYPG